MLANPASGRVGGDNRARNSNFQLHSQLTGDFGAASSRVTADGSGYVPPLAITSFTTNNAQPTFACANTQGLKTGDLVRFPSSFGGLSGYAVRLINVVDNVSFLVQLPYGKISPSVSAATTAYPVGITSPASGLAADHWAVTATATYWPDDWPANVCPGAKRVASIRKGVATDEAFFQRVKKRDLGDVRGTRQAFGGKVWLPSAGTSATVYIKQTSGTTSSAVITSSVSGWQFVTVWADIAIDTTFVEFGFNVSGAANTVARFALPTIKFGSVMFVADLGQPRHEIIESKTHWNPPSTVPLSFTLPATELITGSGLYGFPGLDIEALSFGQAHNTLAKVNAKIEANCAAASTILFVAAMEGDLVPSVPLVFGQQITSQIAGKEIDTSMTWLPLRAGPSNYNSPEGCFVIFGSPTGAVVNTLTFDFDDVMA
jgi:hypothetical protein